MRSMKWMIAIVGCAMVLPCFAGAESGANPAAQKFGAPVTVKKAVSVASVQKNPARFVGRELRIEGVVKDVCQGRGCWVEVEGSKGTSFIARSLDETVLLPKDCKGSRIVVQGVMTSMQTQTNAHTGHEEAEAGHACPSPTYVLATQGIELLARK